MESGPGGQQAGVKVDEEEARRGKRAKLREMNVTLSGHGEPLPMPFEGDIDRLQGRQRRRTRL